MNKNITEFKIESSIRFAVVKNQEYEIASTFQPKHVSIHLHNVFDVFELYVIFVLIWLSFVNGLDFFFVIGHYWWYFTKCCLIFDCFDVFWLFFFVFRFPFDFSLVSFALLWPMKIVNRNSFKVLSIFQVKLYWNRCRCENSISIVDMPVDRLRS